MQKRVVNGKVVFEFGPGEDSMAYREAHRGGHPVPSSNRSFEPVMEFRLARGAGLVQTIFGEVRKSERRSTSHTHVRSLVPPSFLADHLAVLEARERGRIQDRRIQEFRDQQKPTPKPRPAVQFVHQYRAGGHLRRELYEWDGGRCYRRVA